MCIEESLLFILTMQFFVCVYLVSMFVPAPRFTKSKHFMSFSITSETRYANYHYYTIVLCMSLKSSRRIFNLYSDLALLRKYRSITVTTHVFIFLHTRVTVPQMVLNSSMFRLIVRSRLKYKTNKSHIR